MAEETREEYTQRVSEELGDQYRQEGEDHAKAAEDRESTPADEPEALKSWDDYNAHVAQVPGIFGDTDTASAGGTDAVSSKNELATVEVAQKDEAAAAGDEEAAATSDDEARRQVEAQGPQPSAEEVQAGAEDTSAETPEEAAEQFETGEAQAEADKNKDENPA